MQADLRRKIAARAAELAVDKFDEFLGASAFLPPEELLELQEDIEAEVYRELERW